MKKFIFLFILLFLSSPSFAWNAMGHRVIAAIAYDHMTPTAKQKTQGLIEYLANAYPYSSSWQMASVWADTLRQDDVHAFDRWHFYDKPYDLDGATVKNIASPNSVWAINQSLTVLQSPHSNQYEKAFFLRFLLHLVGDAHQPLHDVDFYNKQFPQGDAGGNLYLIKNAHYANLHASWDAGLGFFYDQCQLRLSHTRRAICLAQHIEQDYPESYFGERVNDLNPQDWVNDGYQIAVNFAYQTPENQPLSSAYIQKGQAIVEQQLALAGYRLANTLNHLYG